MAGNVNLYTSDGFKGQRLYLRTYLRSVVAYVPYDYTQPERLKWDDGDYVAFDDDVFIDWGTS